MRPFNIVLLLPTVLALGCSHGPESPASRPAASATTTGGAHYDLHEWGLVSTGPNGFELAAGPGQRVPPDQFMVVDKPVLYVHAEEEMSLRVKVTPGPGLSIAEHFPVVIADVLSWAVDVTPGACDAPRVYPSTCRSPDGYCETAELALYETSDAACLRHGERELPLLFYRMRADAPPTMPLATEAQGNDVIVRNTGWEHGVGGIWRVSWNGETRVTSATRVDIPALGAEVRIPRPVEGGVDLARDGLRRDLGGHGLTVPETDAFMRAWDVTLFGPDADSRHESDVSDESPVPADRPVDVLTVDGIPQIVSGPRVAEAILYWLPRRAIDALATVEATPAPRHLRRAILVRADVR